MICSKALTLSFMIKICRKSWGKVHRHLHWCGNRVEQAARWNRQEKKVRRHWRVTRHQEKTTWRCNLRNYLYDTGSQLHLEYNKLNGLQISRFYDIYNEMVLGRISFLSLIITSFDACPCATLHGIPRRLHSASNRVKYLATYMDKMEDSRGPWRDMVVAFCFMRSKCLNLLLLEHDEEREK